MDLTTQQKMPIKWYSSELCSRQKYLYENK